MTIAFNTSVADGDNSAPDWSVNPAAAAHDVLIAACCNDGGAFTVTWPASFTEIGAQNTTADGSQFRYAVKKDASGSEGALTIDQSGTANGVGMIASFSGCDNTTPDDGTKPAIVNQNTLQASGWNLTTASFTPSMNGCMIVALVNTDVGAGQDPTITVSNPTGTALTWSKVEYRDASGWANLTLAYALQATAGALTVRSTHTHTGTAGGSLTVFVLRPASGGGGTQSYSYTATGGIVFAGASPALRTRVKVPTGGLLLAGTSPSNRSATKTPSGGILFAGSSPKNTGANRAITGGILFGGSSAITRSKKAVPSGGIVFAGTSLMSRAAARVATGGIQFGGTAAYLYHEVQRVVAASGGILFGGSASISYFTAGAVSVIAQHISLRRFIGRR